MSLIKQVFDSFNYRMNLIKQVFDSFGSGEMEAANKQGTAEAEAEEEEAIEALRDADDKAAFQEVYFAKFLTSSKLINLQLRDAYFRRHVLVQARHVMPTS